MHPPLSITEIEELLSCVYMLSKVAVIHRWGHQKWVDEIFQCNQLLDAVAKEASGEPSLHTHYDHTWPKYS